MRRLVFFLLLFSLPLEALLASPGNVSYSLDRITVEGIGDSLLVSVRWTFRDWGVDDAKALVFDMSLKNREREAQLRPVTVYGRKAARRAGSVVASGRADELAVTDLSERRTFVCESVLPYETWMDTVKVLLAVREWNGKGSLVLRSSGQKGCYAKPRKPSLDAFEWNVVEPPAEGGDYRRFEFSVPVAFEDGVPRFDPDYGSNRSAAAKLLPKLRSVTSSKRYLVRDAVLSLHSAPSDNPAELKRLSGARLQSLYAYFQRGGAFATYQARREWAGEDWEGVREWVAGSRHAGDARLVEIVSEGLPPGERLSRLRAEKPAAWDEIRESCLPSLGRVTFSASYRPVAFQAPRYARNVYDEIPELLTPRDFWYISTMYPRGSDEWLDVILTGAALNPGSEELNCDAVFALVEAGAARQASSFLRNVGESPQGRYARALWLYAMGRYAECADVLDTLADVDMFFQAVHENAVPFIDWTLNYVRWEKVDL